MNKPIKKLESLYVYSLNANVSTWDFFLTKFTGADNPSHKIWGGEYYILQVF